MSSGLPLFIDIGGGVSLPLGDIDALDDVFVYDRLWAEASGALGTNSGDEWSFGASSISSSQASNLDWELYGLTFSSATPVTNETIISIINKDTNFEFGRITILAGDDSAYFILPSPILIPEEIRLAFRTVSGNGGTSNVITAELRRNLGAVSALKGDKGDVGDAGVGVASVNVNPSGELIITLTDSSIINAGNVRGSDGVGVQSVVIDGSGNLIVTLTDSTVTNLGRVVGNDGVSVVNTVVDINGDLIVSLSNGNDINAGRVLGADGADGVSIQTAIINGLGELVLTLTDSTVINLGVVVGNDGVSVTNTTIDVNGDLIITLSDSSIINAGRAVGADGVGIQSAVINGSGELVLTYTDSSTANLGRVVGNDGQGVPTGGTANQVLAKVDSTDYNTQWVDPSGGLSQDEVVTIAEGLNNVFADQLTAAEGNAGLTITFVQVPAQAGVDNTRVAILEDNCLLYINDTYIGGFNRGDVYSYEASQGDKITSTGGHAAVSAIAGGRPFEMATAAFAVRNTFFNLFRAVASKCYISAPFLPATVNLYGPNPTVNLDGTSPDTPQATVNIPLGGSVEVDLAGPGEFYLLSNQPVVSSMANATGVQDQKTNPPLSNILIGHGRSGNANNISFLISGSAEIYQQGGLKVTKTGAPGSPVRTDNLTGGPALLGPNDYAAEGFCIAYGNVPMSIYSGADSSGINATSWWPIDQLSQVFVLSFDIELAGSGNSGISFASPYTGTVYVFDGVTKAPKGSPLQLVRSATIPETTNAEKVEKQKHPAAVTVFSNTQTYSAGDIFISNVPVYGVANYEDSGNPSLQSDETNMHGISPERYKPQIVENAVTGIRSIKRFDETVFTEDL